MKYHHMGIPTKEAKKGETYHKNLKFSSTPYGANPFRIQWHRYDDECPLHEMIKTVPHVAFQVENLEKEIEGKNVILGPYSPLENFKVAIILTEDGFPVELIETTLTDEEIINKEGQEINVKGLDFHE